MTYALFRCLRQGPRLNSRLSSNHLSALNYDDWQTLTSQCTKGLFIKHLEYFDYSRSNRERIFLQEWRREKSIISFGRNQVNAPFDAFCFVHRVDRDGDTKNMKKLIILLSKDAAFLKFTHTHQSALLLKIARPKPRYWLLLCRIFSYDRHYRAIGALILYVTRSWIITIYFQTSMTANVTCQHGGNCSDLVNDLICNCDSGWTGRHCETGIWGCFLWRHTNC